MPSSRTPFLLSVASLALFFACTGETGGTTSSSSGAGGATSSSSAVGPTVSVVGASGSATTTTTTSTSSGSGGAGGEAGSGGSGANGGDGGSGGGDGGAGGGPTGRAVINELLPDPPSTDNGKEWVELFNPTDTDLDIGGWTLESGTSAGAPIVRFTFPAGTKLEGETYLVVGDGVAFADFTTDSAFNMGNGSDADIVLLRDAAGNVHDTVVYSSPNDNMWTDDSGQVATSLAPMPTSAQSLIRWPNGEDTDLCADDFAVTFEESPGAANDPGD